MIFTELLTEFGIPYETTGKYCREGWVQINCPMCSGSNPEKPYAGYNLAYGYINCWNCGQHSVLKFLQALTNQSYSVLKPLIDGLPKQAISRRVAAGRVKLPNGVAPLLKGHKRYLRGRNFDPIALATMWQLQGIGPIGRLSWRIFIPIMLAGQTVSWTTRTIGNQEPRYISASLDEEAVAHKTLLFGEDYCRHACVVCEGPFDVFRIGPGAVATMGTGVSPAQVLRLSNYMCRVICFDNEPKAQQRAKELCSKLDVFRGETINVVLDSKDAGEASDQEVKELRQFLF
jgi:hypothetical protein